MTKVEISRGLFVGLLAVAAAALLGLVFALGRATAPAARVGLAGAVPSAAPSAAPSVLPPALPSVTLPAGPSAGPAAATPAPPSGTPLAAPAQAIPPGSQERAAVAAYFKAVEAIQPASGGDPEGVAMQVASGLGNGDTSGLDGMIRQARDTRDRLAALVPPKPCAAYHQELVSSLDEGIGLMQSLKQMVAAPNPAGMATDLTSRANAMKARSESLQSQEKALRQRYCQ